MQASSFRWISGIVVTVLLVAFVATVALTLRAYPMAAPMATAMATATALSTATATPTDRPTATATSAFASTPTASIGADEPASAAPKNIAAPTPTWTPLPTLAPVTTGFTATLPLATPAPNATFTPGHAVWSNGNDIIALAIDTQQIWAATTGGAVAWTLADGQPHKYTTADGLTSNNLTSVTVCPLTGLGIVFGSNNGLQLFDPQTAHWQGISSRDGGMSFDDVATVACDIGSGQLVVGYSHHGLDIYHANRATWTYIDGSNGLAETGVTELAVADGGASIWIASSSNLALLRASAITTYTPKNSPLSGSAITALSTNHTGAVWLATGPTIYSLNGEAWTVFDITVNQGNFPDGAITALSPLPDGNLWVATEAGTLCLFEPAFQRCAQMLRSDEDGRKRRVTALVAANGGVLAMGSRVTGVDLYRENDWQSLFLADEIIAGNRVAALVAADNGMIWTATDGGLQQINPVFPSARWHYSASASTFPSDTLNVLHADPSGVLWIGGERGVSMLDGDQWLNLSVATGLIAAGAPETTSEEITAIDKDAQGRIWVGTHAGLSIWNGDAFFNLTQANGLPSADITALQADASGVWIGSNGGGLYRFEQNQLQLFTVDNARLPSNRITALAASENTLYVGTDQGLAEFVDGAINLVAPLKDEIVTAIAVGSGDEVWVGARDNGVFHLADGTWTHLTGVDGMPDRTITAIAVDRYGNTWIGGEAGGVVRIHP